METEMTRDFGEELQRIREDLARVEREFAKRVIGNTGVLRFLLKAILSGGHVLVEGVPGLGKTLMAKTVAEVFDLEFRRVQFTPDLMPADIVGTNIIVEGEKGGRQFRFEQGPVFTNILLADEINRASPKTQSALLQAMEEHEVTVFGKTYPLDGVFFTMATQNPIEMAGTYPLPEAQLDRFLFKLDISFPDEASLKEIARLNADSREAQAAVDMVLSRERLLSMRGTVREIPVTNRLYDFASRLVLLTHPATPESGERVKRYVRYGSSPRGLNALLAASRVSALQDGRVNISLEDLEENLLPSLRHRLVLRFEAEVEGITADLILEEIFRKLRARY